MKTTPWTLYCPYCNSKADLVSSVIIYKRNYGFVYICPKYPECDSYVGTHKGSKKPLGTMANKTLRDLRIKTHNSFDPMWRKGRLTRNQAYSRLANLMNIEKYKCHISMFSEEECEKAISLLRSK